MPALWTLAPSRRLHGNQGRSRALLNAVILPGAFSPSGPGAGSGGWPGLTGLFPEITCHLPWLTWLLFFPLTPEVRWREEESSSYHQAREIPALSWVGGSQTPALVPSHLWLEVANPALPTRNSLFIFKRTKRGSVGDALPHPGSSCHCWVTAENPSLRQTQWSVDAQHCRGHTVVQSWTKCSITSRRHQPHENTRSAVGLAGEELRPPWVTCSQESGPGLAPHPCVLGSHSVHEVLLTSPHVPI